MRKITTVFYQPTRTVLVKHDRSLNVEFSRHTALIVTYKQPCNTCEPQMFFIGEGDDDLLIELNTQFD